MSLPERLRFPACMRLAARPWRRAARHARRSWPRDLVRLALVLASLVAAALAVRAFGLRLQHTGSLPRGLYRTVQREPGAALQRGAIGMWCLPAAWGRWAVTRGYIVRGGCPGGAEPIGKAILAADGDTVRLDPEGVSVNGHLVPHTRPLIRDARGRGMPQFPSGTYVLGRAEVWVWSPYTAQSLDSRYVGPLDVQWLVAVVRPVWTTKPLRSAQPVQRSRF